MMKTLLLLVVSVLSVNAGVQYLASCIGRCGEYDGVCRCDSLCAVISQPIGCCNDYDSVCPSTTYSPPPARCSNPGPIVNGFISSNHLFFNVGDSVSYSCQDDYVLIGAKRQVCTASSYIVSKPHWVPAQKPECQKIYPCDSNPCDPNAICTNIDTKRYKCDCKEGYTGNGKCCKKMNPCDSNPCDFNARCIDVNMKLYKCDCITGYTGNGKFCKKIYPCDSNPCDPNAMCTNIDMSRYKCDCKEGYTGNGKCCKKMYPCDRNPCDVNARCTNVDTKRYKCECIAGYTGNGKICKKIYPCDSIPCDHNAICTNVDMKRYRCDCKKGYTGNGKCCKKIYPCDRNPCDPKANCTNVDMKRYKCDCIAGYTGNGKFCKKINPCENHRCHRFATCRPNHNGVGYTCQCNCGYFGNGFVCNDSCYDHKCHPMATCYALLHGNYICQCNKGYEGSGKMCKQVFPCNPNPCGAHATCVNVGDSYKCVCLSGYFPVGLHDCRRCEVPKFIDNGKFRPVQRTYPVGSTVTYTCDDGYELKGSRTRRCQTNEKFSGFARCDLKPTIAPPPPPPDSCKDKCGVYSFSTCACDRDCRANRNCCYDYATYCTGNDFVVVG